MDFDEYEYLEKTVENPDAPKAAAANGNGAAVAEEERKDRSRSSKHGAEDEAHRDSGHRRSKRSRADDEDREHERGSSRQRDRSGDGERDRHRSSRERDREREERNGREKDRERERTRDREERERSRRSQSRSERRLEEENHRRQQERSREKEREKERERELKERDFRERERESRRHRDKKEEAAEPEADPERDQRTVFAYQIGLKADERDVYEFFSRAGKVRDVRLIMDRNSRRSKGVGYIEFYDAMAVPMAIALSGQPLLGQPVMVKPSEAEKNLVQSTSTSGAASGVVGPYSGGARRLYVGNLPYNIMEEQLRQVFEPFGTVELVQLPVDPETGHGKGYGFVQFARLEDARAAQSLNGQLPIAGKTIKVSAITDQTGEQDIGANTGDFDDDEGGGLSLNAHSRALLMQKLDRSGTATSVTGAITTPAVNVPALAVPTASVLGVPPVVAPILQPPVAPLLSLTGSGLPGVPAVPVETSGIPCECLLLKNMFDPNVETEPDFELDIKEDVREECSKFGSVKHIFVDKNSAGYVYLRFDSANSAVNAQRALHGRWFAGKMITATFMLPQQYEAKFPSSS